MSYNRAHNSLWRPEVIWLACVCFMAVPGLAGCGGSSQEENNTSSAPSPTKTAPPGTDTNAAPGGGTATTTAGGSLAGASTAGSSTASSAAAGVSTAGGSTAGTGGDMSAARMASTRMSSASPAGGNDKAIALLQTNCFRCHTLNGQGKGRKSLDHVGQKGNEQWMEAQIRTPQQHHSQMPPFGPDRISDVDLKVLATYLAAQK